MKINKRLILVVLSLIMLLSTGVYANDLSESILVENIEDIPQILEFHSEIKYGPFTTEYMDPGVDYQRYNVRTEEVVYNKKDLKDVIYGSMKNYRNNFSINYKGDTSTLQDDIATIWEEIFKADHYLYGTVSTYGYSYSGYENDVIIKFDSFTYHTNKTQENFVDSEVVRIIEKIIEPDMTDLKKVKAINDWIVNNTRYSENTNTSPHAAYTLFNEGRGVCQAYALAAYRLLEEVNIEAQYVTGNAGKIAHGWNLLKIDGKWYHLDTTWNDPVSSTGEDILSYKYFLISDYAIEEDHTIDKRIDYPKATDKYYEVMRGIRNPYEYNNSMYYSNSMEGDKLYEFNLDTMINTEISNQRAFHIIVYDDWIYYSNYSKGGYLFKTSITGEENMQLNSVHSTDLSIELPYLRFYNNSNKTWDIIEIEKKIDVSGISLNRTEDITLTLGGQPVLLETIIEPADATDKTINWISSDPSVITVKDGVITPIKAGNSTITVESLDGSYKASVNVAVKDDYKVLALNTKETDTKHPWTIELSKPVDPSTVNPNNIYIEDEFGEKLNEADFNAMVSEEDKNIITISIKDESTYEYDRNRLYYVVVENTLTSDEDTLSQAVKLPFIIK